MAQITKRDLDFLPRLMSLEQVAQYLGVTPRILARLIPSFRKTDFPNPLPHFGLYDRKIVDMWLDRIGGITNDGRYNFHPNEPFAIGSKFSPLRQTGRRPLKQRSKNTYTVAEAMDAYVNYARTHTISVSRAQYIANATILPTFGHRVVEDLLPGEIRAWHEALAVSPKVRHSGYGKPRLYGEPPKTDEERRKRKMTANLHLMTLKAALNLAFREGKVSSDLGWRPVIAFRGVTRAQAQYLTVDEIKKIVPLFSPDFRKLARAAIYTGARLMELTRLTAADFNATAGTVHFAPGKNLTGRHVVLNDEGQRFFAQITHNLHPTDLLFRRGDGEHWRPTDATHRLRDPLRMADLPHMTFHCFRHTYAAMMVMAGTPIAVVAKNLGHKRTEICERYYAHLSKSYVADEIRAHMPSLDLEDGT